MTKIRDIIGSVLDSIINAIPEDPNDGPCSERYLKHHSIEDVDPNENVDDTLTRRDTPFARAS